MVNKDEITNGYKVLSANIDERYPELTIKQFEELRMNLNKAWEIMERRKFNRRGAYERRQPIL